jgi:hypothetical protein
MVKFYAVTVRRDDVARSVLSLRIIVARVVITDVGVVPWPRGATLAVLTFVLIWLGIYPSPRRHSIASRR